MHAQLLIDINADVETKTVTISVTRMYGLVVKSCDSSKPLFTGQQLDGVRQAILTTLKDMASEIQPVKQTQGQQDAVQLNDGFAVQLGPA